MKKLTPLMLFTLKLPALVLIPLHTVLLGLTGLHESFSAEQIYISIGEARLKKSQLALAPTKHFEGPRLDGAKKAARLFKETIQRDLEFTQLFKLQDPGSFIEPGETGLSLQDFKLTDWTTIGTEFLIKQGVSSPAADRAALELRLYDVMGAKQVLGKRYEFLWTEAELAGHTAANDIMEALTGRKGMFLSKLAFVCNKSGQKEIYVAEYDGSNPKPVTQHRSLAFAPAWSPDGKRIAYSVFTKNAANVKNIDLYEYDVEKSKSYLLINRPGTNSGAAYSPDGKSIALTMSFLGNQEIFAYNRASKQTTRLTQSFGFDVDPSWSPDSSKLAFVSSRAGNPMIYLMNQDGSQVKRLTFAGKFNATPAWSYDGKRIAFAGWIDGHFDVFMIQPDGTNLERLTQNEGSNEDTTFTPDGNFIGFSSTRGGDKNIYMISLDGKTTKRLTFGLGQCEAPKWSP